MPGGLVLCDLPSIPNEPVQILEYGHLMCGLCVWESETDSDIITLTSSHKPGGESQDTMSSCTQPNKGRMSCVVHQAEYISQTFIEVFTLFGKCHSVYDSSKKLSTTEITNLG